MMHRMALATFLLVAVVLGGATPVAAHEGGGDNPVIAFNSTDERLHGRSGVVVSPTASPTVTNENVAYAKSEDCHGCRTVAVAMQAVLITGDASDVRPKNIAAAVNANCTSCETGAWAYQYVVTTGGPVHLSQEGQRAVTAIRAESARLASSTATFDQLQAEFDRLAAEFRRVIDEELVRAGRQAGGQLVHQADTEGS